jgi:hypothetical protein
MVTERQCIAAASESFLDRFFGGALTPMLAHFVRQRRLTKKDLVELRNLLESKIENEFNKPRRKSWKQLTRLNFCPRSVALRCRPACWFWSCWWRCGSFAGASRRGGDVRCGSRWRSSPPAV